MNNIGQIGGVWLLGGWASLGLIAALGQIGATKYFGPRFFGSVQTELVDKHYLLLLLNYPIFGFGLSGLNLYLSQFTNQSYFQSAVTNLSAALFLLSPTIYTTFSIWSKQEDEFKESQRRRLEQKRATQQRIRKHQERMANPKQMARRERHKRFRKQLEQLRDDSRGLWYGD